jgi:hypothetical protein
LIFKRTLVTDQPVSHAKRYAVMAEIKKVAPARRDPQKKEKQKTALQEMEQGIAF